MVESASTILSCNIVPAFPPRQPPPPKKKETQTNKNNHGKKKKLILKYIYMQNWMLGRSLHVGETYTSYCLFYYNRLSVLITIIDFQQISQH